ncbi:MAG: YraN family protein [Gammaproteobacteria bacterium]
MSGVFEQVAPSRGGWAEDLARHFLQQQGLTPLKQNYRCRLGEIDLILRDQNTLVFVEVRYRRRSDFGSGAESVDKRKQRKLIAAAQHFLGRHGGATSPPCRFDVIAVSGFNDSPSLSWIRNAFEVSW